MVSNHTQIFNPKPEPFGTFGKFPRLPRELQFYVWFLILCHERFLRVQLQPPLEESTRGYTLLVKGSRILSKLFRVNRETRQIAQEFYPVKLPCQYGGGQDGISLRDGTFYFRPELDILWLQPGSDAHNHLIPFLSDLRETDPSGTGLRSLALRANDINTLESICTSRLAADDHAILTSVLANLEHVYFLSLENAGRVHLGHFGGIPDIQGYEIHRSRPIMPLTPPFTRLPSDPRPGIDYELSKVFVGTFDPRAMIFHWRKLLQKWHIKCEERTEHHFLLSHGRDYKEPVNSRESAENWLESENVSWLKGQKKFKQLIEKKGLSVPLESEEELQKATKTAVGFWIFPVEALGEFPEMLEEYRRDARYWKPKRVLDLGEYRPQLCLANLP